MRKGTIFKNLWAGYETYFVFQGNRPSAGARMSFGYKLFKHPQNGWEVGKATYYTSDLSDSEHFPVVGHIDLDKVLKDAILSAIGEEERNAESV